MARGDKSPSNKFRAQPASERNEINHFEWNKNREKAGGEALFDDIIAARNAKYCALLQRCI